MGESLNMEYPVKLIPGTGPFNAEIMLIGECPASEEVKTGKPFQGRSGKMLDKMIEFMGLSREDLFITNCIKTPINNNRTPSNEEIDSWRKLLYTEISDISPNLIITLGLVPLKAMLMGMEVFNEVAFKTEPYDLDKIKMKDFLGKRFNIEQFTGNKYSALIPLYHPSFLLRQPSAKEEIKPYLLEIKKNFSK